MGLWRRIVDAVAKRAAISAAYDELEKICCNNGFVYVAEWCEKNHAEGDCIIGDCIGKLHRWSDSQFIVTRGRGKPWEMKYNFFFRDLAASIDPIKGFVKRRREEDGRACGLMVMYEHLDDSSLAEIIVDEGGRETIPEAVSFIKSYREAKSLGVV